MSFVETNESKLYYEESGDGPPVLLLHPAGATASTWGDVTGDLAQSARVIAYDRRGYCRSEGATVHSVSAHTADAAAVLEALTEVPAVVVGTSAGATIALDLAVRRPELVRAVVAHESPWRAMRHPSVAGLSTLAKMEWLARRGHYADAAEVLLRWVYAYREGGSAWDLFPEDWRRTTRASGRSVVADLRSTVGSYPRANDLANITSPVTCTFGSRSGNYMRSITRSLGQAIPTATVRELDGAAHAVSFDAPSEFVKVIIEALSMSQSRVIPEASLATLRHRA